jgi:hypothetical protein
MRVGRGLNTARNTRGEVKDTEGLRPESGRIAHATRFKNGKRTVAAPREDE